MKNYTPQIIGDIVKQKYPAYKSQDSSKLGNAYIAKYHGNNASPAPITNGNTTQNNLATIPENSDLAISLIKKYFPQEQWNNAYNVMKGESGGNPQAVGDNYPINGETIPSYGLFQIRGLPGRPDSQTLLNPEENVKYAAQMQSQQGWGPWTAAKKLGII